MSNISLSGIRTRLEIYQSIIINSQHREPNTTFMIGPQSPSPFRDSMSLTTYRMRAYRCCPTVDKAIRPRHDPSCPPWGLQGREGVAGPAPVAHAPARTESLHGAKPGPVVLDISGASSSWFGPGRWFGLRLFDAKCDSLFIMRSIGVSDLVPTSTLWSSSPKRRPDHGPLLVELGWLTGSSCWESHFEFLLDLEAELLIKGHGVHGSLKDHCCIFSCSLGLNSSKESRSSSSATELWIRTEI